MLLVLVLVINLAARLILPGVGAFGDAMDKLVAVSYTHLDVYKRQGQGRFLYDQLRGLARQGPQRRRIQGRYGRTDVYKRQGHSMLPTCGTWPVTMGSRKASEIGRAHV